MTNCRQIYCFFLNTQLPFTKYQLWKKRMGPNNSLKKWSKNCSSSPMVQSKSYLMLVKLNIWGLFIADCPILPNGRVQWLRWLAVLPIQGFVSAPPNHHGSNQQTNERCNANCNTSRGACTNSSLSGAIMHVGFSCIFCNRATKNIILTKRI